MQNKRMGDAEAFVAALCEHYLTADEFDLLCLTAAAGEMGFHPTNPGAWGDPKTGAV